MALGADFSDPASGFAQDEYAHGRWFYEDGIYGIEVTKQNWIMSTYLGEFSDFALDVDVMAQEDNGCAGVLFRVQGDGGQYYRFSICTDGQYGIDKLLSYESEGAEWETLVDWETSPHIKTGLATNHLRVIFRARGCGSTSTTSYWTAWRTWTTPMAGSACRRRISPVSNARSFTSTIWWYVSHPRLDVLL